MTVPQRDFFTSPDSSRSSRKPTRQWMVVSTILILALVLGAAVVLTVTLTGVPNYQPMPKIVAEYREKTEKIIKYSTIGEATGKAYDWMATVSDRFGHRKIGSKALEDAIDYAVDKLKNKYGFSIVHTEDATLPSWVRGEEIAYLISPRRKKLTILGLGSTVGTNGVNLTKDAVVVTSWDDLHERCNETDDQGIRGKIVVFNNPWQGSYDTASEYRRRGASEASKCGAAAALIRSSSAFSVNSPHTGQQDYQDGVERIPAISLTPEDADLLERMQMRKEKLTISLFITSHNENTPIISRNTIFDLPGSIYPNEIVMLSGHFDSWDVGSGAMDNAAGGAVALAAISNLKDLIARNELPAPKRTIRGIFWTAEEPGSLGSQQFYEHHKNDTNEKYVFLQESDEGFFRPLGLTFSGSPSAKTTFLEQIFPLIESFNLKFSTEGMGDTDWWASDGVPGAMLVSTDQGHETYFTFHHSEGDTPSVYKRNDLDEPAAIWAVLAYVIADMNETLPIGPPSSD